MRGLFFALLGSALLPFAACSVYDEALTICQTGSPCASTGRSGGNGNGGEGGGGNGTGATDSGSGGGNVYCEAPARAIYPPPPGSQPPNNKDIEIVAAQYTIDLGDAQPDPNNPPKHYLEIGFDLDNLCTTAAGAKNPSLVSCRLPSYAVGVPDGKGGIDNALGALIQVVRNQIGNFNSENYSKTIQAGKSNVMLRIQHWNGEPNDDQVTVATMVAAPFDSFVAGAKPVWAGNDAWPVASDAVNGDVDHPKFVDTNAYVSNNQLVATLSEANLRLDVGLTSVQDVKLDLKLTAAYVVCDIVKEATGKWGYTLSKCTLGGRWKANDLVVQLAHFPDPLNNNKPLCRGTSQYDIFKLGICQQMDIYRTLGSPTATCDAISMGVSYTMKPALLGNIFTLKPIADPCCVPPTCTPGSPADVARNPKYDCCESIGEPDGGYIDTCKLAPGTGGSGGAGGGGTGGRGSGGRASGGAGGATGGNGGRDGGTDAGGKDASGD